MKITICYQIVIQLHLILSSTRLKLFLLDYIYYNKKSNHQQSIIAPLFTTIYTKIKKQTEEIHFHDSFHILSHKSIILKTIFSSFFYSFFFAYSSICIFSIFSACLLLCKQLLQRYCFLYSPLFLIQLDSKRFYPLFLR